MESISIGCNQWLSLAKIALKVPPAGRNRSLVALTSNCGEDITRKYGGMVGDVEGLKHGREKWTFWPCNIKPRMARVIRNMAWAHQDREKRVHQTKVPPPGQPPLGPSTPCGTGSCQLCNQ